MMFMMPIPAIRSDKAAIPTSKAVRIRAEAARASATSERLRISKSSGSSGISLWR